MSLEQCTFSPGTVEDSLPISFSAIDQLSLLSGIDMPARSCENEQQTDGSPACKCGKVTSDCLTHPSTPEAWTAFMRDSLAKTFQQAGLSLELQTEPAVVFTGRYCESLAWFDQDSSFWRTYQQSLVTDWEPYLETWPRWGLMQGGVAYRLQVLEPATKEIDGGYLPTLTVCGNHNRKGASKSSGDGLITALLKQRKFPTLNAVQGNCVGRLDGLGGSGNPFRGLDVGKSLLNPSFAEEFMGFPIGYSESKDWVTPRSRSKPQQHTDCSEDAKCSPST